LKGSQHRQHALKYDFKRSHQCTACVPSIYNTANTKKERERFRSHKHPLIKELEIIYLGYCVGQLFSYVTGKISLCRLVW